MIYQGDEVFYTENHSKDEMRDFLNSLNSMQFNHIREFFQTMLILDMNLNTHVINVVAKKI